MFGINSGRMVRALRSATEWLLPKQDRFYELLNQTALRVQSCLDEARSCCNEVDPEKRLEIVQGVDQHDAAAQAAIQLITTEVAATFITPISRDAIIDLVHAMEKVVDKATEALRLIAIAKMQTLPPESIELADLLGEAGAKIVEGIALLGQWREMARLRKVAAEIRQLEHRGDEIYRAASSRLYDGNGEFRDFFKADKFLSRLEDTLDNCEWLAQLLETVAIKHG